MILDMAKKVYAVTGKRIEMISDTTETANTVAEKNIEIILVMCICLAKRGYCLFLGIRRTRLDWPGLQRTGMQIKSHSRSLGRAQTKMD